MPRRTASPTDSRAIEADVTAPAKVLRAAGLVRESYDHVIANPPFHAEGAVRAAPDAARAVAHVMAHGRAGHMGALSHHHGARRKAG